MHQANNYRMKDCSLKPQKSIKLNSISSLCSILFRFSTQQTNSWQSFYFVSHVLSKSHNLTYSSYVLQCLKQTSCLSFLHSRNFLCPYERLYFRKKRFLVLLTNATYAAIQKVAVRRKFAETNMFTSALIAVRQQRI